MTIRIVISVARRVPHVQKELNTLPDYLRLPPVLVCFRFLCNVLYVFVGLFVLLLLVIILSVLYITASYYPFTVGHYIVCPVNYCFWLSLWYLQTFVDKYVMRLRSKMLLCIIQMCRFVSFAFQFSYNIKYNISGFNIILISRKWMHVYIFLW